MSWGRFTLVAILTMIVLLPLTPVVADLVTPIDEPLRSVVIIGLSVAVFAALNQALTLVLGWTRRRRHP